MSDYDWMGLLEKVAITVLILIATYFLAKAVKWAIKKLTAKVSFLQRAQSGGGNIGDSIGSIGSLLVWLFGLVAILQVFDLQKVLEPISGLLSTIMGYLPNLLGAGITFFIGFLLAKVVRQLVETALQAANVDRLAGRISSGSAMPKTDFANEGAPVPAAGAPVPAAGAPVAAAGAPVPESPPTSEPTAQTRHSADAPPIRISSVLANLLFGIIMIVVAIAALQILEISAISQPAEQMLTIVLNTIPAIIAAAIVLGLGYLIAKFVGGLLEQTLRGMGADGAAERSGLVPEGRSASSIITKVVQVAIMFFFAIGATRMLGFPEITAILDEVLRIGGRVAFGAAIIGAGYLIARVISNLLSGTAKTVTRYGILILFAAIGLRYMGLADSIVNLAFGSLVVGGALAAALAFGMGGREAAARKLEELDRKV